MSATAPPLLLERDACGLMSEDYGRIVAADRLAQGFPPNVTDPTALAHIARLCAAVRARLARGSP